MNRQWIIPSIGVLLAACTASVDAIGLQYSHQVPHVHIHAHHHAQARSLESELTSHKCPACNMDSSMSGYDNKYFVELEHGQRVYTCGMAPRSFEAYDFEVSDTSYVAANMAEFVINSKDERAFAKCKNECPECADGIKDPISGEEIDSENFYYVCLKEGQKIYFASEVNRSKYLNKVNKSLRYVVEATACGDATCADADSITKLSPAAASMKPEVSDASAGSSTETPTDTTTDTSTAQVDDQPFCTGASVMFNGFQSTVHNTCVRLFFQPWVLDSGFKYVLGFLGIFGMALFNEFLVKYREQVRKQLNKARSERRSDKTHKLQCKLILSILYMAQMTIAYLAMLVVMIYDSGLFVALILGFGAGFLAFKSFDKDVTDERGVWRFIDSSTVCLRIEGMKCMANCGSTVESALNQVLGVTKAVVIFDEHCAYIAGTATITELIDAVEAVGFSAQAVTAPITQRV